MTTIATLNDVRAAMVARGYPAEEVDAMLDLAGRMVLEGNLATKDDLLHLRDEFGQFKLEFTERMAAQRVEFLQELSTLRVEMNAKFAQVDSRFERIDSRFERIDERFERIDERFERIDERFERVDERFDQIDGRFERMDGRFERMDDRFERMDSRFERMDSRLAELNDKVGQLFVQFAEMRAETTEKLSAASIDSRDQFSNMLRWVVGVVIAGIGVNAAVMGIGLAVLALTAR